MIALFSTDHFKRELHFTPKKEFIYIRNVDDIRGRTFTGVIETYGWWECMYKERAMELLKQRHPELWIKN